jgi:hypothetical protein
MEKEMKTFKEFLNESIEYHPRTTLNGMTSPHTHRKATRFYSRKSKDHAYDVDHITTKSKWQISVSRDNKPHSGDTSDAKRHTHIMKISGKAKSGENGPSEEEKNDLINKVKKEHGVDISPAFEKKDHYYDYSKRFGAKSPML